MATFWDALKAMPDEGRIAVAFVLAVLAAMMLAVACSHAEGYISTKWTFGCSIFGSIAIAFGLMNFVDRLASL